MPGGSAQCGSRVGRPMMDWIERWFGFAPDNGDGSLELLIAVAVAAAVVIAVLWRIPRARAATLLFVGRLHKGLDRSRRA